MDTNHTLLKNRIKRQRLFEVVNQKQAVLQSDLSWQFKKLFIIRLLSENVLTFLLQYIGLAFIGPLTPAPCSFASGTACAFIFMRGYSVLPGILIGSFCAYYLASYRIFYSCVSAGIETSQAFLIVWLSFLYINPTLVFYNINKFIKFILCCSILTAITNFIFIFNSFPQFEISFKFGLSHWLGNLNGILVFACAIVTWDLYFPQIDLLKKIQMGLFVYYGLLFISIITLLFSHAPLQILLTSLFTLLLILFVSLRFGWCGSLAAVSLFGLLLNLAAYLKAPLFSTDYSMVNLVFLQILLFIETVCGLFWAIRIKNKY